MSRDGDDMAPPQRPADLEVAITHRAGKLFDEHRRAIFERTDRLFAVLLVLEWLFGLVLALVVSPRAWAGTASHPHVWAAVELGGLIVSVSGAMAYARPGQTLTRHVISCAQMLVAALFVHLTGGHTEAHFLVFASLAFLAFYRDWHVLIPATLVVATDHLLRGSLWPQSVYGVTAPGGWRWLEHAAWVAFEDVFLIRSCLESVVEMRAVATRRAQLESANERIESAVAERTRELAESEARFLAFMDNSPLVKLMKDQDGRYVHVNRTFERVFGRSRDDVVGRTDRQLWRPDVAAAIVAGDDRVLGGSDGFETTETLPAPDGTPRQWSMFRFPLADAKGRPLLGAIALDVTEKLQLAEKLRQSNRMEAVGQLAGGIAHDFNNLLTAVTGYAKLLMAGLANDKTKQAYVSEIAGAAERAAGLTKQLLAFSRKQMLKPRVIDVNAVVSEAEELLRRLIGEHIRLEAVLDPELNRVLADAGQLEQVIVNLVLNARDAMPDGGRLTIETANVELGAGAIGSADRPPPGRYALLAVSDTGTGMTAKTQAHIFEPFFTTKGVGQGTGLGLSTAHGIVHQSGGHILVYSELGIGTTFKIYIPAVAAGEAELEAGPAAVQHAPRGPEVVLLVEDDAVVRRMVGEVLAKQGYEVLVAEHGEQGIELAKRHRGGIDILVTDVVLPGLGGRQLAERLARLRPGLRVLFMSGYAEDAIVKHGFLEPGVDFILKPFMPDALSTKVREILDRRMAA